MKTNLILQYLRYDWPMHFILLMTNWLPDNVIFMKLRGALVRPFFGSCGKCLTLERNLHFHYPHNIFLGENVFIGTGSIFLAIGKIHIADTVLIAPYCVIATGNHTYSNGAFRNGPQDVRPVSVGRGSWLGAHVMLTPGAVVGSGSCVAAGAVVVGKIDDNVLVGGTPARVIKKINEQEQVLDTA